MFEKLHLCITYEMNGDVNSALNIGDSVCSSSPLSDTVLGNGKSHVDEADATCQALARACGRFVT